MSTWFVYRYFLPRDSITTFWKPSKEGKQDIDSQRSPHLFELIQKLNKFRENTCQNQDVESSSIDQAPNKIFDRVILVVIDALGAEFVPSLKEPNVVINEINFKMPFVERSLGQGLGLGFVATAVTPTVTMPRIKSLVSGTIPSFLDLVHNLARDVSKFEDDNIVQIANSHNKTIVFYGDDTWLSLFNRDIFLRSRETLSMYASDYTSVDTNVTEEALPETRNSTLDWDMMILHYIGLDHIGHVFGSNNHKLINQKLLEMDQVIEQMYNNMAKRTDRTLLIICGDHGMTRDGNHGGGSDLEVNTAMIFMTINQKLGVQQKFLKSNRIFQFDLATTLANLMGLPVPSHSRGVLIEPLVESLWKNNLNHLTCSANNDLKRLLRLADHSISESSQFMSNLISIITRKDTQYTPTFSDYIETSKKVQEKLLNHSTADDSDILMVIPLVIVAFMSMINLKKVSISLLYPTLTTKAKLAFLAVFLTPILMQGSTDFIELEHLFWPVFTLMSCITLFYTIIPNAETVKKIFNSLRVYLLFGFHFLILIWNHRINILDDESTISTLILPLFSIFALCNSIRKNSELKSFQFVPIFLGIMIAYLKMLESHSSYHQTSLNYIIIVQQVALLVVLFFNTISVISHFMVRGSQTTTMAFKLASGWLLISYLLTRPCNLVNLMSNIVMETSLDKIAKTMEMPLVIRALLYFNFAQSGFYGQGNSNLFTTIDLKAGFYGQTSYSFGLASLLVGVFIYSTQIYWILKLFQRVQEQKKKASDSWELSVANLISLKNYLSLTYYMFVCLVLKNHLFIWSVISPKLLYHYVGNNVILLVMIFMNSVTKFKEVLENYLEHQQAKKTRIAIL